MVPAGERAAQTESAYLIEAAVMDRTVTKEGTFITVRSEALTDYVKGQAAAAAEKILEELRTKQRETNGQFLSSSLEYRMSEGDSKEAWLENQTKAKPYYLVLRLSADTTLGCTTSCDDACEYQRFYVDAADATLDVKWISKSYRYRLGEAECEADSVELNCENGHIQWSGDAFVCQGLPSLPERSSGGYSLPRSPPPVSDDAGSPDLNRPLPIRPIAESESSIKGGFSGLGSFGDEMDASESQMGARRIGLSDKGLSFSRGRSSVHLQIASPRNLRTFSRDFELVSLSAFFGAVVGAFIVTFCRSQRANFREMGSKQLAINTRSVRVLEGRSSRHIRSYGAT
jgi:hypothetical protein